MISVYHHRVSSFLFISLLALVLSACGGGGTTSTDETPNPSRAVENTGNSSGISAALTTGQVNKMIIDTFPDAQQNIEV